MTKHAAASGGGVRQWGAWIVLASLLAGVLPVWAQGGSAPAGASSQPPDLSSVSPGEGDSLSVYLLTVGQGDAVWERFGHNAIGIRDRRTNIDIDFNWGLFDFSQPDFIPRFVRGDMMYWMAGFDARAEITSYVTHNRDVTIQELNLTSGQRAALLEFLKWNAREENKFYGYDYFRDNCSTRVRDALDRVLHGAIHDATSSVLTTQSYRDHALRLMALEPLVATGIDIGLGRPADRPITVWEEMFIPMRMRDRLRSVQVPDEHGRMVPLVTSEHVLAEADRPAEAVVAPNRKPLFLAAGTAVAVLLVLVAGVGAGRPARPRMTRTLLTVWCLLVGTLGLLLVYLRTATHHVYAYGNMNLLEYSPLWFLAGLLIPVARAGTRVALGLRLIAGCAGAMTVLAMLLACIPAIRQDNLAVLLLVAPANLAAVWIVWRALAAHVHAHRAA